MGRSYITNALSVATKRRLVCLVRSLSFRSYPMCFYTAMLYWLVKNYRTRRGACHHVLSPRIHYFMVITFLSYANTFQTRVLILSTLTPRLIRAEIIRLAATQVI